MLINNDILSLAALSLHEYDQVRPLITFFTHGQLQTYLLIYRANRRAALLLRYKITIDTILYTFCVVTVI